MSPLLYTTASSIFTPIYCRILFGDTSYISMSKDMSAFANGKQVFFAIEGLPARPKFNSTTGYGAIVPIIDTPNSFVLDELITEPLTVDLTEEQVIAYAKKTAVIQSMTSNATIAAHARMLTRWAATNVAVGPTQNVLRTTGAARPAGARAATGNRNAVTYQDILRLRAVLDKQNVPVQGRCILITPTILVDLMQIPQFTSADYISQKPLIDGFMGSILGMQVFMNNTGLVYTNAVVPINQNPDDNFVPYAGAATDNESLFMWHPDFVMRAISPATRVAFVPGHAGDSVSFTTIVGGAKCYLSQLGVAALVEQ